MTRPTVTTAACTVRPNHVLVENGWTNTVTTGAGGGNTANYPQSYIRLGTQVPRLEVDLTPPTWNHSSVGGMVAGGSSDISGGLSYEIGYTSRAVLGVNAAVTAPVGAAGFTAGGTQYIANVNWSYSLGSVFSLAGTVGYDSQTAFNAQAQVQRFNSVVPSVVVTYVLPSTSQAFIEYVYFSHAGLGLGGKSLVDFGLQHDFGRHIQADAEYGFSPTVVAGQTQHYVGLGLSFMN